MRTANSMNCRLKMPVRQGFTGTSVVKTGNDSATHGARQQ
jgi:hypothetical protein